MLNRKAADDLFKCMCACLGLGRKTIELFFFFPWEEHLETDMDTLEGSQLANCIIPNTSLKIYIFLGIPSFLLS